MGVTNQQHVISRVVPPHSRTIFILFNLSLHKLNIKVYLFSLWNKSLNKMSTLEFQQNLLGLRQQLYYFALSLTKNKDDASDLLQDCMVRAITYREKFQDNTNFKAWVYTIMRNTFINGHRRIKRGREVMDAVSNNAKTFSRSNTPTTPSSTLRAKEIESMVGAMDPAFGEPFKMHYNGFKYDEIAAQMDIPVGTVKSRIFQARKRLRNQLGNSKY